MNQDVKTKWLEALRSGDYQQGRDALRDDSAQPRYCCLGVLCDLAVKEGVIGQPYLHGGDWVYGTEGHTSWSALPRAVAEWAGMYDAENPDHDGFAGIDAYVSTPEERRITLAGLNDTGHTFEQIADIIEAQL